MQSEMAHSSLWANSYTWSCRGLMTHVDDSLIACSTCTKSTEISEAEANGESTNSPIFAALAASRAFTASKDIEARVNCAQAVRYFVCGSNGRAHRETREVS